MNILSLIIYMVSAEATSSIYLGDYEENDCYEIAEMMQARVDENTTMLCQPLEEW